MAIQDDELIGPATFEVSVSEGKELTIVELSGELDIATAGTLQQVLSEQIPEGVASTVRLDLDGLTFLGSSGISVIVAVCKRVRASGGTFRIHCGPSAVRRALQVVGLIGYLEVDRGKLKPATSEHPPRNV